MRIEIEETFCCYSEKCISIVVEFHKHFSIFHFKYEKYEILISITTFCNLITSSLFKSEIFWKTFQLHTSCCIFNLQFIATWIDPSAVVSSRSISCMKRWKNGYEENIYQILRAMYFRFSFNFNRRSLENF
jgi:hypothetical protein